MTIHILLACLLAFLTACATPYQPKGFTGGYSHPKTEIEIWREAQKDLVGRAGHGYNGCATKHNH
jgi:hypothetical protein